MKRRRKGTGTIERTSDGQHRARFPFERGVRSDVGVYPTHAAAAEVLDALVVELHAAGGTGRPLRKVVEKYFANRQAAGYSSVGGEESRWKTYFESHALASRPVQELTQGEVLDAILAFRRQKDGLPLGLSTRKNILNIIRGALYVAKADGLVESNVLVDATFPDPKGKSKRVRRKRRALTWDQFVALWGASSRAPEIAVAIWTGCRQGELRALHWADVHNVEGSRCTCDEHRADPHVVIRYGRPPAFGIDCSPKNGEERVVSLFGLGLEVLRTMSRGGGKNNKGIVFVSRLGGYRAKGRLVGRKQWTTWRQAAGLSETKWHDLRHTCGTWLVRGELRMGVDGAWPLEAVKEHLGHSELRTTEIYADQRSGSQARAMAARARALKPETSPSESVQVLSHLRDLNSRPTVYESRHNANEYAGIPALLGLARAYLKAVASGDQFAETRGLELAEAVLALSSADVVTRKVS